MTSYEAYKLYLALRNHFNTSGYDFFKYAGKASGSSTSFEKRKDKFFFEKLAKHRDPQGLMVANFVRTPKVWVRDLAYSEESERRYLDWIKRQQSLTYTVSSDLSKLDDDFNENFTVRQNEHPLLLRLYSAETVSPETLCVLVDLTKCYSHWNKALHGDPVWDEVGLFIRKYIPFVKYDKEKVKTIITKEFEGGRKQ